MQNLQWKRILTHIVILIFQCLPCSGQSYEQESQDIMYFVDYARFQASKGYSFVEVYYGIMRSELKYEKQNDQYAAHFKIDVKILNDDSVLTSKSWRVQDQIDSLGILRQGHMLTELYGVFLQPGVYHFQTVVTDLAAKHHSSKSFVVDVFPQQKEKIQLSDIQLATHIFEDSLKNRFVKNGLCVYPNPRVLYGKSLPVLYYYMEIYHLSPLRSGVDSTYEVHVALNDGDGNLIKNLKSKVKTRRSASVVDYGQFYIGNLITGVYELRMRVIDRGLQTEDTVQKSFWYYKSQSAARSDIKTESKITAMESEFAYMSEEELDQQFDYIQYIIKSKEKRAYRKLTIEGKKEFLHTFWMEQDQDPFTVANEYKQEYYQRLHFANVRFTSGLKAGWKTDRGRVLLLYGYPDDLQQYPFESRGNAYIVWRYFELQGDVEFIFIDESGYGDFRLKHSTARNEINNYNWRNELMR